MNSNRVIASVLTTLISVNLSAQTSIPFSRSSYIEPYKLEVTYNKTTNLVFPATITSIDRGSQDIVVQKANRVENILRIKADVKSFQETNLSVITNDGKLYSFLVSYNNNPAYLNINVGNINVSNSTSAPKKEPVIYSEIGMNETNLMTYSLKAASARSNIHTLYDESSKMCLELKGIYIQDNIIFLKLMLENTSRIIYDIDQLRFYIRDKRKAKRTASQEVEIHPVHILGDTANVRGQLNKSLVIAVPKFTIPDEKYFIVEMMERNGGRHLALKVKNRHILKARTL